MHSRDIRTTLKVITALIDNSKECTTNDFDCILNLAKTGIGSDEFHDYLSCLRREGLVEYSDSDSVIEDISLTSQGRIYPKLCKQEIKETFLKSFACPVLVAAVAAIITTLITNFLT